MALWMLRSSRRLGAAICSLGVLALLLASLAGCALPQPVPGQSCISQQRGSLGAGGGLVVPLRALDPTTPQHISSLTGVRASDGAIGWSCASSTYAGWDDAQLVNGVIYGLAGTEATRDTPAPTHAHGLYAIRPHDGQQLWSYSFQAGSTSALAFDGGLLFFSAITTDGSGIHSTLYAIHAASGALAWSESFGNALGQPIIVGHKLLDLIFSYPTQGGSSSQELRAVSESDGSMLWSNSLFAGDILAGSLSRGGALYYMDGSALTPLTALDGATGKIRWSQPINSDLTSALFGAQGAILFSTTQNVFAFDQATGAMRWSAVLNGSPQLLAVSSARAYAATLGSAGVDGHLYALDVGTGDVLWQQDAPSAAIPTGDADGATYFTTSVGPKALANVVALDPRGALRWTYQGQSTYQRVALIPHGGVVYYVWQALQAGISVNAPGATYVTCLRASDGAALWTTPLAAPNAEALPPMLVR